jgi:hypothetical protein
MTDIDGAIAICAIVLKEANKMKCDREASRAKQIALTKYFRTPLKKFISVQSSSDRAY